MAFSNLSDLTDSVNDWLNRDDMAGVMPDLTALVEAELNRVIVSKHVTTQDIVLDSDEITLPVDVLELRSLVLTADDVGVTDIKLTNPGRVQSLRNFYVSGTPRGAYVRDGILYLGPTPDMEYDATITYEAMVVPLLLPGDNNWVLLNAPDVYLYGCLCKSAPWAKDDDRLSMWSSLYKEALSQLKIQQARYEYGASPLIARPKRSL